jgi:ribonuclease HI
VAGKVVTGPSASSKPVEEKFYAVAVGLVPGVYREWTEAQEQIVGVKGPKYKKFPTKAEAEEFVKTFGKRTTASLAVVSKERKKPLTDEPKKNERAESFQPATKKAKTTIVSSAKSKAITVHTDGSSLGNGKIGASAGVGVFFGVGDER